MIRDKMRLQVMYKHVGKNNTRLEKQKGLKMHVNDYMNILYM